MAGAHDPGDPGLYSSPDLQVEIRFRERHLSSLASAVASPVTDPTPSARGLASLRYRLSGRAYSNLKRFSVFQHHESDGSRRHQARGPYLTRHSALWFPVILVHFLRALQPRRLIRAQSKANFVSYTVQK